MSAIPLPKSTHASSVLICEECGAEAQILGSLDGPDATETVEMWNREHAQCGADPVASAWQSLVQRGDAECLIDYEDDLAKLSRIPRPSWAPVERDSIRGAIRSSAYRSRPVAVPLTHHGTEECDNGRLMSRFEVAAKRLGQGENLVGVTLSVVVDSEWRNVGVNLTLDEVHRLIEALAAACDLAVTE
ncbi:hypothetical protein [Gordonia metallireducens]|uniref:hypothetical protein n=1 Tax=Gordonia metallireducens TaxID=2897779 RepID=UPI001E44DFFE|nr:hypothetical protein [Gordonia metallireducens]